MNIGLTVSSFGLKHKSISSDANETKIDQSLNLEILKAKDHVDTYPSSAQLQRSLRTFQEG